MTKIAMPLPSPDEMDAYIATAKRQRLQRQQQLQQRRSQGLMLAKEAADLLRHHFGVSRVVLFGSILSDDTFHEASDLDLAVWDLPAEQYLDAISQLLKFSEFSIDLVPAETAPPYLQAAIAQGVLL